MPQYPQIGVPQMPPFSGAPDGAELAALWSEGQGQRRTPLALMNVVNLLTTAFSGGGQTNATQLNYGYTCIASGYTSNDSVALPAALAGAVCNIFIEGGLADALAVWVKDGSDDTINGISDQFDFQNTVGGTIPLTAVFICAVDGAWLTNTTAD